MLVKEQPDKVNVPLLVMEALPPVNVPPEKLALEVPMIIVLDPWLMVPE